MCCRDEYERWRVATSEAAVLDALEALALCLQGAERRRIGRVPALRRSAEDLVQQAWLKFQSRYLLGPPPPERLRLRNSPLSVFRTTVNNLVRDSVREKGRRDTAPTPSNLLEETVPEGRSGPDSEAERGEQAQTVRDALKAMAASPRAGERKAGELLLQFYFRHRSALEIAEAEGRTVNAVHQALSRARKTFEVYFLRSKGAGEERELE